MYRVRVDLAVAKALRRLPRSTSLRIGKVVDSLGEFPRPLGARKLAGRPGLRIRVGDYRMLYEIDDVAREIHIFRIAHRKEAYR